MSISDHLMARYYPLLLGRELPTAEHPMAAKKQLAQEIVATYHSARREQALADWERRFSEKRSTRLSSRSSSASRRNQLFSARGRRLPRRF